MLNMGGFTPLSTTDWPNMLAAVVFVQGCPWRCHYCHNVSLQARSPGLPEAWTQALSTLQRRQGLLDGVVFSGGEPTLDPGLPDAIRAVRALGFRVGLHTAGIYPDRLRDVLPMLDWVGFDIKTRFADYEGITATPRSGQPAWLSLTAVLQAARHQSLGLEVRTTWHPALHDDDQLLGLADQLCHLGITSWVLQQFRPTNAQHESLAASWHPPSDRLLEGLGNKGLKVEFR
jgi:pyruvate formate lyase activating enzyme